VSFTSGDGFTFWNSVDIRRDGRATLRCSAHAVLRRRPAESRSSFRLAPRRLAALRRALAKARFATLANVYPGHGADSPSYAITYGGKRVYVGEFAIDDGIVPKRLVRVISMLNAIVEPEAAKALAHPQG
jgi:hypothetical protein